MQDQEALVVSPAELDFGTISVIDDGWATMEFELTNAGTSPLTVHGHDEVVGDDEVFEVAADGFLQLDAGASQTLQVAFRPDTEATWWGELRVNYGIETLTLRGAATAPVLVADTPDIAATAVGCSSDVVVPVRNVGSEPLELLGVELSDDTQFELVDVPLETLAPGESVDLALRFTPVEGGMATVMLNIDSTDPLDDDGAWLELDALGVSGAYNEERFDYAPGGEVDLLVVADTDGVMDALLRADARLDAGLEALLDTLASGNLDLHLGVLTGDNTCPTTSPVWSDSASALGDLLRSGLTGESGTWSTQLVALAVAALGQTDTGECLEGFTRDGAQLHVVAISGGEDQSGQTLDATISALNDVVPRAQGVVVSALIAADSGGCDGLSYGAGYVNLALATGGAVGNLCDDSWVEGFTDVAEVSVSAMAGGMTYALEAEPVIDTLSVTVDAVGFGDWTYDAESNAVVFADDAAPESGAEISIRYMLAQTCAAD